MAYALFFLILLMSMALGSSARGKREAVIFLYQQNQLQGTLELMSINTE